MGAIHSRPDCTIQSDQVNVCGTGVVWWEYEYMRDVCMCMRRGVKTKVRARRLIATLAWVYPQPATASARLASPTTKRGACPPS